MVGNRQALAASAVVPTGGKHRMLLSTKGDYGVRAMIDLAKHEGEGPVQRAEIARRREIPEAYLDHLLAQLRRDGFIRSTRGPAGGHQLAKPATEICLLHLLESLEGSLAPMQCLENNDPQDEAICGQDWVWQEIYDDMRAKLASVSLANLAEHEHEHERERATATWYVI